MAQKHFGCSDIRELRKLVDPVHLELSINHQCLLLALPWSTHDYWPTPLPDSTQRIIVKIYGHYLGYPCRGSRRMVVYLAKEGDPDSRHRVQNLKQRMGL